MATKKTVEQQIAETERKLARLKQRNRAQDTGQKIVIGGLMIAAARRDDKARRFLLDQIKAVKLRAADLKRVESLLGELQHADKG